MYLCTRGGSWDGDARYCRSASRYGDYPSGRGNFLSCRLKIVQRMPERILRGGHRSLSAEGCRSADRLCSIVDARYDDSGHRLKCNVTKTTKGIKKNERVSSC
jgi:formylglycine-generating enzyme required for sulfatase activity